MGKRSEQTHWVEMSERIEAPGELLLGLDVRRAGDPVSLYAPIFAVSRTSGWTAHVPEQYANNRLIRPRAEYTGKAVPQPWVPLEQR